MVKIETNSFEQAVQQYVHTRTSQARKLIWHFIHTLPTMYFVQCGRESRPIPWITFEEEAPLALIFTSPNQALEAAKGLIEDVNEVRVIGLPTNAAAMYVTALAAQGIEKVCFNHGPQRFDAHMDEVLSALQLLVR
tara:strand:+ start:330 stop:737 length:408 start_codon:yes stop_codon:yes gene_type:complete